MINAPQVVLDALASNNVSYANLITVNLGDAYGSGDDVILYYTDYGHAISFGGNTFTPDNNLTELAGISRKASTGSDAVDVVFGVTDESIIGAIKSERYINKPTTIERVVMEDGAVIGDFAIPVRTAWGLSHSISGDDEDRTITLTIDSSLGDLDGDNGWYAINSSHEQRYAGDKIMRHSSTVMTEDQQKKYTSDFTGSISSENKPPALPKIYGYKNVELVPICMLKHNKHHTTYRHYFTTFIYAISIGDVDYVDISNLMKGDDRFTGAIVSRANDDWDIGGWSASVRTPNDANTPIGTYGNGLNFWLENMSSNELERLDDMYGKGLTLLFVKNRNRDNYLTTAPTFTVPVYGAKVYDPRSGSTVYSRNPALQYADFLRSTEYGAGQRGIDITNENIIEIADHFDALPDSEGNDGIDSVKIDIQLDTGEPLVDNMNIWMEGVRLYTSDYYGVFNVRVESKSAVAMEINENDLLSTPEYESGEFTERLNQLTYTVKQLVEDTDEDAEDGDLIEVDVEATFPEDGSDIHTEWLAEDGGIVNFESSSLSYVTDLEQGYYWAMVDSRISRQPRKLNLVVGAEYWLSEVGDVVSFTSEVMEMDEVLWRIDEISEDDGGDVELSLVAYDDEFYTPDPDAIPAPTDYASPPTTLSLSAVSGVAVVEKSGLYYLTWTPLSSANVSWYSVEVMLGTELAYSDTKITNPPYLLSSLVVGDYTATITAIGIDDEGEDSTLSFSIQAPVAPTLNITVGTFDAEITPTVENNYLGTAFEVVTSLVDDFDQGTNRGRSSRFTLIGLSAETTYYAWGRTHNAVGVSDWAKFEFTTGDGSELTGVIGDIGAEQLDEATQDLLKQLDRNEPDNIIVDIEANTENIAIETNKNDQTAQELFELTSDYADWIRGYEERLLTDETLIDAAVYVDPETGSIVNRAYSYTDDAFTQASLSIDGVSGEVEIQANRITASNERISKAESDIIVNADNINLRATYTEVDASIASAMESLVPAYSWQFNTGADGWSNVTWNASGYIIATSSMSISSISFDADVNVVIETNVKTTTAVSGTLSWNGGSQNISLTIDNTGNEWIPLRKEMSASDGWSGIITSLQFTFDNVVHVDSIAIGQRSASDLALADLESRTSTIEVDIDAGTGSMGQYATTVWVNNLGYQTQSDVNTLIDTFNTTYSITATLQEFNDNNTLEKANSAQTWVDGADANIRNVVISYNAEEGGVDDKLTIVETEIDGLNGKINDQVISIRGLEVADKESGLEGVLAAYNNFLQENKIQDESVKLAYARQTLSATTTDLESLAEYTLDLTALYDESAAQIKQTQTAFANEQQATAESFSELTAQMGEGDEQSLASANAYTRASVGYCVDADGNIVDESNAVACVAGGNSWIDGVIAEFIRNLQIDKDGSTASISDIRQVFEDDDGTLIARGSMLSDVNNYISGFLNNNDGTKSNFDIIADIFRVGLLHEDGKTFLPSLYLDQSGESPTMIFKGNVVLGDGTDLKSVDDIKAEDGIAVSVEFEYSIDGTGNWHFPMVTGDEYQRERTKTQKGEQDASYSDWSNAAQIKGDKGDDGSDGANGADGTDGTDGDRGAGRYEVGTSTGVWSDTTAKNTVPNDTPVIDDVVTIYKSSDAKVQTTKRYNGSSWVSFALHVHGDALVDGTVHADKLVANTITADQIDSNTITVDEIQSDIVFSESATFKGKVAAGVYVADSARNADNRTIYDTQNRTVYDYNNFAKIKSYLLTNKGTTRLYINTVTQYDSDDIAGDDEGAFSPKYRVYVNGALQKEAQASLGQSSVATTITVSEPFSTVDIYTKAGYIDTYDSNYFLVDAVSFYHTWRADDSIIQN